MLGTFLVSKFRELGLFDIIFFKQNGAPAHFSIMFVNFFCNNNFRLRDWQGWKY